MLVLLTLGVAFTRNPAALIAVAVAGFSAMCLNDRCVRDYHLIVAAIPLPIVSNRLSLVFSHLPTGRVACVDFEQTYLNNW